ncbi:hypothetical protein PHET_04348 [Paragonimus heterotremus]|uniref:Centrosomal protein of 131 kDa n=1 Tax=Paragonimus heterotremus TaxID=100268 RepID=A0A8J4TG83_9TREM|nr:hypothetical protein PHET_04348 [Paragonimus heterotremus]
MLNLSLRGSQICLSKTSNSSTRNSSRTYDKSLSAKSKLIGSDQSHIQPENKSQTNESGRLHLLESDSGLSAANRHLDQLRVDGFSPNAFNRSRQNVSDWLDAYVHSPGAEWDQIEITSLNEQDSRALMGGKNDPDLKVCLDSLEVMEDEVQPIESGPVKNSAIPEDRNNDCIPDELSEDSGDPPPCFTRPISNSIHSETNLNSGRYKDKDEFSTDRRGEAARTIQLFWRRHRRRILAAQAALRRLMGEQKRRILHSSPTIQGMPIREAILKRTQSKQKCRMDEHRKTIQTLHKKRSSTREEEDKDESNQIHSSEKSFGQKQRNHNAALLQKPTSPMITPKYSEGAENLFSHTDDLATSARNSVASISNCAKSMMSSERNPEESDDETLGANSVNVSPRQQNLSTHSNSGSTIGQHGSQNAVKFSVPVIKEDLTNGALDLLDPRSTRPFDEQLERTNVRSRGWSEMLNEIHRVLSEPDDQESYTLAPERVKKYRINSAIVEPSVDRRRTSLSQTANNMSDYSGKSCTSALTLGNLQEHTRRLKKLRQREQARKAIEESVSESRLYMHTLDKSRGPDQNSHCTIRNNSKRNTAVFPNPQLRNEQRAPAGKISNIRLDSAQTHSSGGIEFSAGSEKNVHRSNQFRLIPECGVLIDGEQPSKLYSRERDIGCTTQPGYIPQTNLEAEITLQTLSMQLEERTHSVQRLQNALEQQRELSLRQLRDTQRDAQQRLESIKADYESTIARNYKLIDELIEEKKTLHAKCESLMTEMKTISQKAEEKLRVIEDRHKVELRKAEAKIVATEKLRREKWETEKARQMKEMTVRGMETEIAQLIAAHKAEIRNLRQQCTETVEAADARAYQAYTSHIEELRQTLTREKEEACVKERELANQRLEKTLSEERAALEIQRRRLLTEVSDERERLALTAAREREQMEQNKHKLEDALARSKEDFQIEIEKIKEEVTKRQQQEIEQAQQRNVLEREAWEEHIKSVLEAQYLARENGLRDQLKRERDKQLEAAVKRLEADANELREETERETELKIKRIREKLGAEISELERSEKQAMEKYCEMKTKLLDKEHESDRLRIQLQQKEEEISEVRSLYEKLHQERQNMSDIVRQEFADRLVSVEEENRSLKRNLAELKARLTAEQERNETELRAVKQANAAELESLHGKIKEAIKRKDDKMALVRKRLEEELKQSSEEVEAANRRAEHLEELLDEQRRQFLQATQ